MNDHRKHPREAFDLTVPIDGLKRAWRPADRLGIVLSWRRLAVSVVSG